eukprot:2365316-Rhodomonas_salina.1
MDASAELLPQLNIKVTCTHTRHSLSLTDNKCPPAGGREPAAREVPARRVQHHGHAGRHGREDERVCRAEEHWRRVCNELTHVQRHDAQARRDAAAAAGV